jgi:SAM-dependent methyltransferase
MSVKKKDSWFVRRIMRLTGAEKRAMNSPSHAQRTVATALGLLEHVNLPPRSRCLEIGCGQGALARFLTERLAADVVATDLGDRVTFQLVDARALPFPEGAFDAVFSFGVMHHIPKGGWRSVVSEASRVVKKGGVFVFTDIYLPRWEMWLFAKLFPRFDPLEENALRRCLTENGLAFRFVGWDRHALGLLRYGKIIASKRGSA